LSAKRCKACTAEHTQEGVYCLACYRFKQWQMAIKQQLKERAKQ